MKKEKYDKPVLRIIELKTDEILAGYGCKSAGGFAEGTVPCDGMGCNQLGS